MNQELQNKALEIVEKISRKKVSAINLKGTLKDELALDSIQIVELFARLEAELNIELPLSMMNSKTGEEFLKQLEQTITEQHSF